MHCYAVWYLRTHAQCLDAFRVLSDTNRHFRPLCVPRCFSQVVALLLFPSTTAACASTAGSHTWRPIAVVATDRLAVVLESQSVIDAGHNLHMSLTSGCASSTWSISIRQTGPTRDNSLHALPRIQIHTHKRSFSHQSIMFSQARNRADRIVPAVLSPPATFNQKSCASPASVGPRC